jgi:CheY-like chemotaxis protein
MTAADPIATTRVLVVDDEPAVCRALRRLLKQFGVDATLAQNAQEALAALDDRDRGGDGFTAIVSDHRMPWMTGTDLLREVRARHPRLLRILMTGWMDEQQLEAGQADGSIELLLTKPWVDADIEQLVAWIGEHAR